MGITLGWWRSWHDIDTCQFWFASMWKCDAFKLCLTCYASSSSKIIICILGLACMIPIYGNNYFLLYFLKIKIVFTTYLFIYLFIYFLSGTIVFTRADTQNLSIFSLRLESNRKNKCELIWFTRLATPGQDQNRPRMRSSPAKTKKCMPPGQPSSPLMGWIRIMGFQPNSELEAVLKVRSSS